MANQIFKHLTVDVAELNTFQSIVAKQYDVNSRFLIITLVNEGEKINVDLSSTVLINAERADHAADSFAGVVNSDGTITVPITSWMLELDDFVTCDISILGVGETKLSSTSFTIEVQAASNYADDPSDEEQNNLVLELIDQLGGKANFNGTATSFNDCTQPNTLYNVVSDNKNYLVGAFNPNAQWCFEVSEGIKARVKINGTWREWQWVAKLGIDEEVIAARGTYASLSQRLIADETAIANIGDKADYATINAIFSTDGKLLDVSRDSTLPSVNTNAVYAYLDKNVTTISKSTLLTYYPNLTTVYVDNNETDVTITGTGELNFVFKGDFNAGQLLYLGISKHLNSTDTRLTTLENTVGTLNSAIASQLNLNEGA